MHTKETLDAIRLKAGVEEIAEGLGLSTEGTRDEIEERILAFQEAPAESPTEEVPTGEAPAEDPAPAAEAPTSDPVPETPTAEVPDEETRSRDEDGQFTPDDPDTQPDEAYDPPTPREVTAKAKEATKVFVATYIGDEAYAGDVEERVVQALEEGKQPCVVRGSGNARFAVKIFSDQFDLNDLSKDVVPKTRGCVLNVARSLANIRLYPGE